MKFRNANLVMAIVAILITQGVGWTASAPKLDEKEVEKTIQSLIEKEKGEFKLFGLHQQNPTTVTAIIEFDTEGRQGVFPIEIQYLTGPNEGWFVNAMYPNNQFIRKYGLWPVGYYKEKQKKNYTEKDKHNRAKADLRTLATALESYNVDYNRYPDFPEALTTPIAYITSIPKDPFASGNQGYRYINAGPDSSTYLIQSKGPDQDYDVTPAMFRQADRPGQFLQPGHPGHEHIYDPSNGTISSGDILRTRP